MEYIRNPNCECSSFVDIETIDFSKRKDIKDFWMKGYIYKNGCSKECDCHKRYRLSTRYNILAGQFGLADYEELSQLKYMGTGDSYKKLKLVPQIVDEKNLKNLIAFVYGPDGCQKTTSCSKLVYNLITSGKTVHYVSYSDLTQDLAKSDFNANTLLEPDWLFIDDCFEGETINFRNVYNSLYNILLKRKKPTIIISPFDKEKLLKATGKPFYNEEMLNKLFNKINIYKAYIHFEDNVEKIQITENGPIDLWSL